MEMETQIKRIIITVILGFLPLSVLACGPSPAWAIVFYNIPLVNWFGAYLKIILPIIVFPLMVVWLLISIF